MSCDGVLLFLPRGGVCVCPVARAVSRRDAACMHVPQGVGAPLLHNRTTPTRPPPWARARAAHGVGAGRARRVLLAPRGASEAKLRRTWGASSSLLFLSVTPGKSGCAGSTRTALGHAARRLLPDAANAQRHRRVRVRGEGKGMPRRARAAAEERVLCLRVHGAIQQKAFRVIAQLADREATDRPPWALPHSPSTHARSRTSSAQAGRKGARSVRHENTAIGHVGRPAPRPRVLSLPPRGTQTPLAPHGPWGGQTRQAHTPPRRQGTQSGGMEGAGRRERIKTGRKTNHHSAHAHLSGGGGGEISACRVITASVRSSPQRRPTPYVHWVKARPPHAISTTYKKAKVPPRPSFPPRKSTSLSFPPAASKGNASTGKEGGGKEGWDKERKEGSHNYISNKKPTRLAFASLHKSI